MKRIAVIGGGASGLTAAVCAAERAAHLGVDIQVTVYEATDKIGRPILASGNGRCNFSNSHISVQLYNNAEFVSQVIDEVNDAAARVLGPYRAAPNPVVRFFELHGLMWREEAEGRLYPSANKASVVLDVLKAPLSEHEVRVRTNAKVAALELPLSAGKPFTLRMEDGTFERADMAVVAFGGAADAELLPSGLQVIPTEPVLGPIATETRLIKHLDNVRVKCKLSLVRDGHYVARENGEAMFRKYGVSGIAAFNLSRKMMRGDTLQIDFLPQVADDDVRALLSERLHTLQDTFWSEVTVGDFLRGMLLPKVADMLMKASGLKEDDVCTEDSVGRLLKQLKRFSVAVRGIGDAAQCQVHRGGVAVDQIDAASMQVQDMPGLYCTGEALDVDGPCGGYNLHWAFATGMLAGWSAAEAACSC